MKQLIIENRLPVPIFMKVEEVSRKDEETGNNIIEVALYFEQPECDEPELHIRKVEIMQQFICDLPDNSWVEMNVGDLGQCVNFEASEDAEMLFVRLAGLRPARN